MKRCSRNAVKDGYCKQHHPDAVKARRDAQRKRWDEKQKNSPIFKLKEATETIKRLRKERNALIRICLDEGLKYEQLKDDVRSFVNGDKGIVADYQFILEVLENE